MSVRGEPSVIARDGGVRIVPETSGFFDVPANEPGFRLTPALFSHPGACVLLSYSGEVESLADAEALVEHGDSLTEIIGTENVKVYYRIVDALTLSDVTPGDNDILLVSYLS